MIAGGANHTLPMMLGAKLARLTRGDNLSVNGDNVGDGDNVVVVNGTRLWQITRVMRPATK